MHLKIYLSGSIRKGTEDTRSGEYFWTDANLIEVREALSSTVEFLNPATTKIDRNDYKLNFGCDLYLVSVSDLILVDLRKKKGVGVGAELMYADALEIPVIGWLPSTSEYQREKLRNVSGQDLQNWIHPFAFGLCDELHNDLSSVCERINELVDGGDLCKLHSKKAEKGVSYFKKVHNDTGSLF